MSTRLNIRENFNLTPSGSFFHAHAYEAKVWPVSFSSGQPVALLNGFLVPANSVLGSVAGVALERGIPGFLARYVTRGPVDLQDWSAIIGNEELLPQSSYFLRSDGTLSNVPPPENEYLILVGVAQTSTILDVTFSKRVNPAV